MFKWISHCHIVMVEFTHNHVALKKRESRQWGTPPLCMSSIWTTFGAKSACMSEFVQSLEKDGRSKKSKTDWPWHYNGNLYKFSTIPTVNGQSTVLLLWTYDFQRMLSFITVRSVEVLFAICYWKPATLVKQGQRFPCPSLSRLARLLRLGLKNVFAVHL